MPDTAEQYPQELVELKRAVETAREVYRGFITANLLGAEAAKCVEHDIRMRRALAAQVAAEQAYNAALDKFIASEAA